MSALDEAEQTLRAQPVADVGQLLKPGGRHELEQEIARLATAGLRAHVVVAPPDADLAPFHTLWPRLGFAADDDLLLLFNGQRWEARGWNLSPAAVNAALLAAEPALRQYYGKGLATALGLLGRATQRVPEPRGPSGASTVGVTLGGLAALAAMAGVGWVMVRRRRRAQESHRTLAEARLAVDRLYGDMVLASEEMPAVEAAAVRDKATRLRAQIDALVPANVKQLPAKQETLTLARLLQMENELEALRSTVLQVKRKS